MPEACSEHVLPYVTSAVPAGDGGVLYSPDANASQSDGEVNSIYQLDFSSCLDFLSPILQLSLDLLIAAVVEPSIAIEFATISTRNSYF